MVILFIGVSLHASAHLTVFAAASMSDTMTALAAAYSEEGGETVRFNFASSGALARQVDAGAPADLFVCANKEWMDWLEERKRIVSESRFNLAGNCLVMVSPTASEMTFDGQIPGRLAVGDFRSVPAGLYAKAALEHMGWLETLKSKLVMGSSVRTVLMYVERGEVDAGIVYASDAQASEKVRVVGTFPAESHAPIVYPVAACSGNTAAFRFLAFLKTDQAQAILVKHGFTEPHNE